MNGYRPQFGPDGWAEDLSQEAIEAEINARQKAHREGDSIWPDPAPLAGRNDGDATPFPLDLLPNVIRKAAGETARFVKIPVAAPALCGMSAIATAIGKRALVEERFGHTHHPSLFIAGIAGSGERKGPAFKLMTRPLEEWIASREQVWEEEMRRVKARNVVVDNAISVAKRKAKVKGDIEAVTDELTDLENERLPVPPHPRLFTTDATEQRVTQLMHEREGAFAVMSGEGRPVLDAIMGKYSGYDRTGDAIYLAGISGDTVTRDRVGGEDGPEALIIRKPCLNVCIMVQPDKYLEAASHPSLRESGALARIWPVKLPSLVGHRIEEPGEAGLSRIEFAGYNALIFRLLNYEPRRDAGGLRIPHKATLSVEAAEARRAFHNEVEHMMREGGDLVDCKDIASKAVSQTCKLALCLHLARDPGFIEKPGSEIDAGTWTKAQSIGSWFLSEAVRMQRIADEDPVLAFARRIVRWLAITKRKRVNASNLMQLSPRPRPDAKRAHAILDLLADHGYLRDEGNQKARSPIYLVHPEISHFSHFSQG